MTALKHLAPDDVRLLAEPVLDEIGSTVDAIEARVRAEGWTAVRAYGEQFGDVAPGEPAVIERKAMRRALDHIDPEVRRTLERVADRISSFASVQRAAIQDIVHPVPGGQAGLRYAPVETAGCYAPGGRYPLPSSVLMTALTARAAGVSEVWVCSPRPAPATLAAAALADADALLAIGGAQGIFAMGYGAGPVPRCASVVGPGNSYVVAAKKRLAGRVNIDMLAGPSELLVVADAQACPDRVAADLLAQAEHDPEAVPALIALDAVCVERVQQCLIRQLSDLPTAEVARAALDKGWVTTVSDVEQAARLCNRIAPEHLSLQVRDPEQITPLLTDYGALFIGEHAAEVLGDYGAGPNHTLPTGGTARATGALSVLAFLRAQTWLRIDNLGQAQPLVRDSITLARVEGLEAHARAAEARVPPTSTRALRSSAPRSGPGC